MQKYTNVTNEEVAEAISMYDTISGDIKEDAAYGGYDGVITEYDTLMPTPHCEEYEYINDGTALDIIRFENGARLMTNGYELLFMSKRDVEHDRNCYRITTNSSELPNKSCLME
jgi:hypothetical protein